MHNPNPAKPINQPRVSFLPYAAQKIVEQYALLPEVRLIMTIGSVSAGTSDANSDIDLVLICNRAIPLAKDRISIIQAVASQNAHFNAIDFQSWIFGASDNFSINGQEICTQFFTKDSYELKVDQIVGGEYERRGMENPLASLASLLNASLNIDKDGLHKHLLTKISPYPSKLQAKILSRERDIQFPYYLNRLETAIARNDLYFANAMVQQALESALHIIFAKNKTFPKGLKRLPELLQKICGEQKAQEILLLLHAIVALPNTFEQLTQKQIILKKLTAFL